MSLFILQRLKVTKKGCVRTQLPPVEETWMKASETSKGKVLSEIVIIVY